MVVSHSIFVKIVAIGVQILLSIHSFIHSLTHSCMMTIKMHIFCVRVKHCGRFSRSSVHINFKFMEKDLSDMNEIKSVEWPKWPDNTFKKNGSTDGFLLEKKPTNLAFKWNRSHICCCCCSIPIVTTQSKLIRIAAAANYKSNEMNNLYIERMVMWLWGFMKKNCILTEMAFVVENYYTSKWNE